MFSSELTKNKTCMKCCVTNAYFSLWLMIHTWIYLRLLEFSRSPTNILRNVKYLYNRNLIINTYIFLLE